MLFRLRVVCMQHLQQGQLQGGLQCSVQWMELPQSQESRKAVEAVRCVGEGRWVHAGAQVALWGA